jgi:hypothetical protein
VRVVGSLLQEEPEDGGAKSTGHGNDGREDQECNDDDYRSDHDEKSIASDASAGLVRPGLDLDGASEWKRQDAYG